MEVMYRQAVLADIPELMELRLNVSENKLSNPALVTPADCEKFLTLSGRGWVAVEEGRILGFAIVDTQTSNVWALFIRNGFEGRGMGKVLQQIMLDWYFSFSGQTIWLSTSPGTRAEIFYERTGWTRTGMTSGGEIRFEMSAADWAARSQQQ